MTDDQLPDDRLEAQWGPFRLAARGRYAVTAVIATVAGVYVLGRVLGWW